MDSLLFFCGLAITIIVVAIFGYRIFATRRRRKELLTGIIDHVFPGTEIRYVYHSSRKKGAFDPSGLTCQVAEKDLALSIARRSSWHPTTGIFKRTPVPIAVMILPLTASDFSSYKRVAGFMGLSVFPEFINKFGALAQSYQELDKLKSLNSWSDFVSAFQHDPKLIAVYFLGSSEGLFSSFFSACGGTGILIARTGEATTLDQGMIKNYCKLLDRLAVEINS